MTHPRMALLTRAVEDGDDSARFWKEMEVEGTPIVGSHGDGTSVVTFVWRGDADTKHIALLASALPGSLESNLLERLGDTDVFHRSYLMDDDMRTGYRFVPNGPLLDPDDPADLDAFIALSSDPNALRADPLNPNRYEGPAVPGATAREVHSILELPRALPQPFVAKRNGIVRGWIDSHRFKSTTLGNEREVWVYKPPGYDDSTDAYGVLLVFDGPAYLTRVPTHRTLDNLHADGLVPPMLAVLVSSIDQPARSLELPCHEPFASFVAGELMPWLRERYRVSDDPLRSVVAGSSYGGLAASFIGLRHPELFGNVLSQSGSYWWGPGYVMRVAPAEQDVQWEWLTAQYDVSPRLPLSFWIDVGRHEVSERFDQVGANERLRDVLLAKGHPVTYLEFNGGHDYFCWRGTLGDGLLALLGNR